MPIAIAVVTASIRIIDRREKPESRLTATVGRAILAELRDWKAPGDK